MVLIAFMSGEARAAVKAPIVGEIESISVVDPNDVWSRGAIVVGGQNIVIPRNLIIQLPANRLTLQQLFDRAPPGCAGETGLARADACNAGKNGAVAAILANRTDAGDVIAGDVFIEKGVESVTGTVTFIDHTDGYFRLDGVPGDATTGAMVRINDPDGVYTVQQGLGCGAGPNCSPDPRFGGDPENYTSTFVTGYPLCLPSTVTGGNRITGSDADGVGDPFCPAANRPGRPVADSHFFAPLQLGDNLTARGNFEAVGGVRFLSAHTVQVHAALTTRDDPAQPDYLIFSEAAWGAAGFQNQGVAAAFAGFTTLPDSRLDIFALHHDASNAPHEVPIASTVGNPSTTFQGTPPTTTGIFAIEYEVNFLASLAAVELSPCINLFNAGLTGCPGGNSPSLAENFAVLSPISRDIIARSRHKTPAAGDSKDIRGNTAPNGQYLTPVTVVHPEFEAIDVAALQTPFLFAGEPWNLDRRLGPQGCDGACAETPQPLDPFPFSGLDPRTQAKIPAGAADRILSFFPFGAAEVLAWPPLDPPAQNLPNPAPPDLPLCTAENAAPAAVDDKALTDLDAAVAIDVLANDIDIDGSLNPTTVEVEAPPASGLTSLNPDTGEVIYSPDTGFAGADTFVYTVKDNAGAKSNRATVRVRVGPNDVPMANPDAAVAEGATAISIDVLANDSDADGLDGATVKIESAPGHGSASVNTVTGAVAYQAGAGFVGEDGFTYRVRDLFGALSNRAAVTVTVNGPPEPPPPPPPPPPPEASDTVEITEAVWKERRGVLKIKGTVTPRARKTQVEIFDGAANAEGTGCEGALLGSAKIGKGKKGIGRWKLGKKKKALVSIPDRVCVVSPGGDVASAAVERL